MVSPLVLLSLAVTCVGKLNAFQTVKDRFVDQLAGVVYHPVSVIQDKFVEDVPTVYKSVLVQPEIGYPSVYSIQPNYARNLYYRERDIASGYAYQVLNYNVVFTIPGPSADLTARGHPLVAKENVVQSKYLKGYAGNVEPVNSRYIISPKSDLLDEDSGQTRLLSSPQFDSSYNFNIVPSTPGEVSSGTSETEADVVKKAPLYTEAIFKPWSSLKR